MLEGGKTEMTATCGEMGFRLQKAITTSRVCSLKRLNISTPRRDIFVALDLRQDIVPQGVLREGSNKFNSSWGRNPVTPVFLRVNRCSSERIPKFGSFKFNKDGLGRLWRHGNGSEGPI